MRFLQAPRFFDLPWRPVLKAVAARNEERVEEVRRELGLRVVRRPTGASSSTARTSTSSTSPARTTPITDIAIAAAKAGKMVMCEKPLGRNAAEARSDDGGGREAAGVPNTVWYNYRRVPAVTLIKQLIDEGKLGRIFHYRAKFLQDWTISADLPQGGEGLWRLDVAVAGSGVTGDLLAHNIDTALWLNGPIAEVTAMTETFIKERKHNLTGKVEPVGIDDASAFLCRFENGSLAMFEATRYARGHKALYTLRSTASTRPRSGTCTISIACSTSITSDEGRVRGWRNVHVTDGDQPYMKHWWVPGLQIGYEHTFIASVRRLRRGGGQGQEPAADVPRRAGHRLRHRRGPEVGQNEAVGKGGSAGRRLIEIEETMKRLITVAGVVLAGSGARRRRRFAQQQAGGQPPQGEGRGQGRGQGRGGGTAALNLDDRAGFESIFDGTMKGWDGDPAYWKAEVARLVGESTAENPVKENTFVIWRGGEPADFELKLEFKMNSTNSGIQFRSQHDAAGHSRSADQRSTESGC